MVGRILAGVGSAAVIGLVVGACSDTPADNREPDRVKVEAAVVTQVAQHSTFNTAPPIVYVKPLDAGQSFGLDHQAGVISASAGVVEVVFVENDDEATTAGGITGDGAFVAIGPVRFSGSTARVRYDEIFPGRPSVRWDATLSRSGEQWALSRAPVTLP